MFSINSFLVGGKVKVVYNGEVVDEAIILEVSESCSRLVEIEGRHGKTKFALFDDVKNQWRMLFPDPFTDVLCYSERGPVYALEVI